MRKLLRLAAAILIGLAGYLALFVLVVHKPLTLDLVGGYIGTKRAILAATPSPRIMVLAGSNGRYSHSCAEIARATNIPCANLSTSATMGLRYQVDNYIDLMRAGDLVYMPIEYREARFRNPAFVGDEGAYLAHADPAALFSLYSLRGTLSALFGFDLRFLVSGVGEIALDAGGLQRRAGLQTLNAFGDEAGHGAEKAAPYRDFLRTTAASPLDPLARDDSLWADVSEQVRRLRARGVIVVGGLPTTLDDIAVDDATVAYFRHLYRDAGACLLVLPNRSRYPRAMFFDTIYHLQEPGQHAHSRLLAPALANLAARGCPAD